MAVFCNLIVNGRIAAANFAENVDPSDRSESR
jgi:hypothetical protein